jgi:hypothetical protein
MRGRWGAFSVRDHRNAATLICELALYDRLLIPFPPTDECLAAVAPPAKGAMIPRASRSP